MVMVCFTRCHVLAHMLVAIFLRAHLPSGLIWRMHCRCLLILVQTVKLCWETKTGWFAVQPLQARLLRAAGFPAECAQRRAPLKRLTLQRILTSSVKQLAMHLQAGYAVRGCWIVLPIWSGVVLLTGLEIFRRD